MILWHTWGTKNAAHVQTLADEFNESQDKYEVTLINQASAGMIRQKMAALTPEEYPAIFCGTPTATCYYDSVSYVKPLQDYLDKDEDNWEEKIYSSIKSAYSNLDGDMIGSPFGVSSAGYFVNIDMIKQAGYTLEDVTSFEKMVNIATDVYKKGIAKYGMSNTEGGTLTIDGKNVAKASMLYGRGVLELNGVVLKNGNSGNGSAVQLRNNTAQLITNSCSFESNVSTGTGGAVSLTTDNGTNTYPTATLTNTTFVQNKATTQGGAIYMAGGTVDVLGTGNFTQNSATQGGAIYQNGGTITLSDGGKFEGNTAGVVTKNDGRAGAVDVVNGTFNVTGYDFIGNSAVKDAGALRVDAGTANVTNCNFTNNSAGTPADITGNGIYNGRGGAIYISGGGKGVLNLLGTGTFSGNTYTHTNTGTVSNAIYNSAGAITGKDLYTYAEGQTVEPL